MLNLSCARTKNTPFFNLKFTSVMALMNEHQSILNYNCSSKGKIFGRNEKNRNSLEHDWFGAWDTPTSTHSLLPPLTLYTSLSDTHTLTHTHTHTQTHISRKRKEKIINLDTKERNTHEL